VLAAREIAMLVLSRYGLRHGVDVKINWPGRLAVPPVMGSLFFAMAGLGTLAEVLLYLGLALALLATALYIRDGLRIVRARRGTAGGSPPGTAGSPPAAPGP
jgi:cardiolipin synthase